MVTISPFKGFRTSPELVEKVATLPYDVVTREEALSLVSENSHSFFHIIKPEIDVSPEIPLDDDSIYLKGAENLRNFVKQGILNRKNLEIIVFVVV